MIRGSGKIMFFRIYQKNIGDFKCIKAKSAGPFLFEIAGVYN